MDNRQIVEQAIKDAGGNSDAGYSDVVNAISTVGLGLLVLAVVFFI